MKSVCITKLMRDKERRGRTGERAQLSEVWASGWAPTLPCLRCSWSALMQADKMASGKERTCPSNKFTIQKSCQQLSLKKNLFQQFWDVPTSNALFYIVGKHHKWLQMLIVHLYLILSVAWLVILNPINRNRRYFLIYFLPFSKADC